MAATTDKFTKAAPLWTGTIGAGGVADSSTGTIPLNSASGLTNGEVYYATIDRVDANGVKTLSKREVVKGVLSGTNLITCDRGVEGTAQAHSAGAVVEILYTAAQLNDQTDGMLVEHNATGTHKQIDWVSATDGTTITFDLEDGAKQKVTLGGNRTLALSNVQDGHIFVLKLIQGSGGSKTVTWFSGISWPGNTAPTLSTTAAHWDVFIFIQTGTNTYDGFTVGQDLQ